MLLSVITINYNNAEGLKRTFESVFSQTSAEFEYIVIDGGSSDGSKELIEQNKNRISCWISEKDRGIYHAMNKGISAANGEYVIFINSGDLLYDKNIVEKILPELDGTDVVSGDLNIIEKDGRIWMNRNPEKISFRVLFQYTILHPCSFIRRSCFEEVGLYDEKMKIVSDWKWFLLAFGKHGLCYRKLDQVIATFYADGVSSGSENRQTLLEERRQTLMKHFPLFFNDYQNLISTDYDSRVLQLMNRSRWTRWGKKLGLLKKAALMEEDKKKLFL